MSADRPNATRLPIRKVLACASRGIHLMVFRNVESPEAGI